MGWLANWTAAGDSASVWSVLGRGGRGGEGEVGREAGAKGGERRKRDGWLTSTQMASLPRRGGSAKEEFGSGVR